MAKDQKVGKKLNCAQCGNQVVVVRPSATEITCCGEPMAAPASQSSGSASS